MSRGLNSRAQNRGCKYRMTSNARDNCADDMVHLAGELGVPVMGEPYSDKEIDDEMGFGLPEALATAALFALAGILNAGILNSAF